jgi:hypothetical protein
MQLFTIFALALSATSAVADWSGFEDSCYSLSFETSDEILFNLYAHCYETDGSTTVYSHMNLRYCVGNSWGSLVGSEE